MVRRGLLLLLIVGAASLAAEDLSLNDLEGLLDEALQLNITAKVLPPNDQPVYDVRTSKLTIPGRPIAVKMVGENRFVRNLQERLRFRKRQRICPGRLPGCHNDCL